MNLLKFFYLAVGLVILAVVFNEIDLAEVAASIALVGWGMALILFIYFMAFLIDSFTWQLALVSVPLNTVWLYRTWKARMVGEVFNSIIPAGGMGGEPVKAVLLKKHYGIGYRESAASLILGKTVNMISLVVFLAGGFVLMWGSPVMPTTYKVVAILGLGAFGLAIVLFYAIQRFKVTSITGAWIGKWRLAGRINDILHHVRDMDERLVAFYTRYRGRFALAVVLALVNWMLGILEIYYAMIFLGHPISLADAWIIESAAQLVRAGTFFIPASIGAQEGTFLLICTAMTGSPVLAVSVAVIRRFREIIWIAWGLLLGSMYSLRARSAR